MDKPVTLITGTRKGIGKALAEHYLRAGHVVVGCSRAAVDWDAEGYTHVCADVTDEDGARELFAMIRQRDGCLHNLINNAGIGSMNHSLLTPLDTLRRILDINVGGTFVFSREAAKLMRRRNYGRIVNFTSIAVPFRLEGEATYLTSKAAVEGLTRVLSREFADFGITVNAVGPAPMETDLTRAVPRDKLASLVDRQAIRRFSTMADIFNVCDFFLQPQSSFVTGQVLYLGGA